MAWTRSKSRSNLISVCLVDSLLPKAFRCAKICSRSLCSSCFKTSNWTLYLVGTNQKEKNGRSYSGQSLHLPHYYFLFHSFDEKRTYCCSNSVRLLLPLFPVARSCWAIFSRIPTLRFKLFKQESERPRMKTLVKKKNTIPKLSLSGDPKKKKKKKNTPDIVSMILKFEIPNHFRQTC